jgi:CDGSH-type Zn-finger protein
LSYRLEGQNEETTMQELIVEVNPTGPLIVKGDFTIIHPDGREEKRTVRTTLCRCGASKRKPFCDASHKEIGFKG